MSERKIVDICYPYGDSEIIEIKIMELVKKGYIPLFGHTICRGTVTQAMVKYED